MNLRLVKGTKVMHSRRGPGEVLALDWTEKRGKPVFVQFENGEVHSYSLESATKLKIVGDKQSGDNDSAPRDSVAHVPLGVTVVGTLASAKLSHMEWNAEQVSGGHVLGTTIEAARLKSEAEHVTQTRLESRVALAPRSPAPYSLIPATRLTTQRRAT
jgi:hypothetical protein